jgi:UDP-glucose 4-epimerase
METLEKKKFLITGGAGFIGGHLARLLVSNGHRVAVIDLRSPIEAVKNVRYELGNIHSNSAVEELVVECDVVIHLAAIVGVRRAMQRPLDVMDVNSIGTYKLLSLAQAHAKEFVLGSSSYVYGKPINHPTSERDDMVIGPLEIKSWIYAVSKLAQEAFTLAHYHQNGLPVKIFRLFNCVGAGQSTALGNALPIFVEAALQGNPLRIFWDGRQTRTYIHVEDAVRAIYLVAMRGRVGEIYNIGGVDEIETVKLAEMVIELSGSRSIIEFADIVSDYGGQVEEPRRRVPDISKLVSLGFDFRRGLKEAILDAVAHGKRSVASA